MINWSADSFQINHVTSMSCHMSPRYGHGILIKGSLIITVNCLAWVSGLPKGLGDPFSPEAPDTQAVQCPTLESLESLWNGYCSGFLNDVVENFLVTDELKRKLGLDKVRLKTTIEQENYLICRKAFMENSGELGILSSAFLGTCILA